MKTRTSTRWFKTGILIIGLYFISGAELITSPSSHIPDKIRTAIGNPDVLKQQYERWKLQNNISKQTKSLKFSLVQAKQHIATPLEGQVTINAITGELNTEINRPTYEEPLSLWLTHDNQLYATDIPNNNLAYVGEFQNQADGSSILHANISSLINAGFQIGQVIIAPSSSKHLEEMVLAGSPSLFQRLFAMEQRSLQREDEQSGFDLADILVPISHAAEATGFPQIFNDLVTQGEDVFFNETFDGNTRTCGTCHPATNNFTLDVDFIAALPNNDPLFVAEFVPALIFGSPENLDQSGNPRRFENPQLMRNFGLILENVDGFGDLTNRFTMRSVTHNIGMAVSIATPPNDLTPPNDRTGWSGDGAPSGIVGGVAASGRLRDFTLGAIVQHFPKTLARSFTGPNPDFRIASVAELDAIEAFLFSIGRQVELDLNTGSATELVLRDPNAEAGKVLFRDGVPEGNRTCNGCHSNAGANVAAGANPGNRNFNTGVELFLRNRINDPSVTIVGQPRPVDGGFGTNPAGDFTSVTSQANFNNENFGNGSFNTTSLVEAADTAPFFHNNIVEDLEGSIAFYNSPEFLAENGGSIPFNQTQIEEVADFLRVINAIDNIENSVLRQAGRVLIALQQGPQANPVITRIVDIMIADTRDAIDVLNEGQLHNFGPPPLNAVTQLQAVVFELQQIANPSLPPPARATRVNVIENQLNNVLSIMKI